jgi:hypothetical protein
LERLRDAYRFSSSTAIFKRAQEPVILGGELDLARGFEGPLWFFSGFGLLFVVFVLVPAIETNGRFEDEEDVVTGSLDFADRLGDAVRFGKGIVLWLFPVPASGSSMAHPQIAPIKMDAPHPDGVPMLVRVHPFRL